MATHNLDLAYEVLFEDGTIRELEVDEDVYFFHQQKGNYYSTKF